MDLGKFRQAIGLGASAALLASLFTAGAASTVLAANSSTGGGTVLRGGTSAAGSISFTEDAVDQFSNGSFTVHATDADGADNVSFAATALTVTRTFGVGSATAAIVGGDLVVTVSGTDDTKIDGFTISGLKIAANGSAAFGGVRLLATADGVGLSESAVPASGVLAADIAAGANGIAVTMDAGSPAFIPTGNGYNCTAGKVTIAASGPAVAETLTLSSVGAGPTLTFSAAVSVGKPAGTAVTQTTCAAQFPSFVSVGDAIKVSTSQAPHIWNAGVSRQDGPWVIATLGDFDGLLPSGAKVTFTIATPGVTFSTNTCTINNCWDWDGPAAGLVTADPALSADLKTLTFTLARASKAGDFIEIDADYDVAPGVAAGTEVDVNVGNSASAAVSGNPAVVAYVGTTLFNVTSTVPNVIIAQTNQSAGVITLTESAAGSFTDSAPIEICLDSPTAGASWASGTYFWAKVTSGDLKLNIGGLPVAQGKLSMDGPYCLQILDYTASTTASTIQILTGTADAPGTTGPRINVWNYANPGPIFVNVYSGGVLVARNVIIANAVFSGTPMASAASQPVIFQGGIAQAAGDIVITEGQPGGFRAGQYIGLCIEDQAHNFNTQVRWSSPVGVNTPVVTTNNTASGIVAHFDAFNSNSTCLSIRVDDDSLVTLGTITISNLKFDVVADAVMGPVFVRVLSDGEGFRNVRPSFVGSSLGSAIDQTVSNARVGTPGGIVTKGTALGATKNAVFTLKTKVAKLNGYVTWKFDAGSANAGKVVAIWVQTKAADGTWGHATKLTSRVADGAGNVYFWWRSSKAAWISVQARLGEMTSKSAQARWR